MQELQRAPKATERVRESRFYTFVFGLLSSDVSPDVFGTSGYEHEANLGIELSDGKGVCEHQLVITAASTR
jgi:hypothetical protein